MFKSLWAPPPSCKSFVLILLSQEMAGTARGRMLVWALVGPVALSILANALRQWGTPRVGLFLCVTGEAIAAMYIAAVKDGRRPLDCFVLLWSATVSCAWWLHVGWTPLVFLVCLCSAGLGVLGTQTSAHQTLSHFGKALLSIMTAGMLEMTK